MNGRMAKKLRKEANRQYRDSLRAKTVEQIDVMAGLIKPRPSWCPAFVWGWLRRLLLNV